MTTCAVVARLHSGRTGPRRCFRIPRVHQTRKRYWFMYSLPKYKKKKMRKYPVGQVCIHQRKKILVVRVVHLPWQQTKLRGIVTMVTDIVERWRSGGWEIMCRMSEVPSAELGEIALEAETKEDKIMTLQAVRGSPKGLRLAYCHFFLTAVISLSLQAQTMGFGWLMSVLDWVDKDMAGTLCSCWSSYRRRGSSGLWTANQLATWEELLGADPCASCSCLESLHSNTSDFVAW